MLTGNGRRLFVSTNAVAIALLAGQALGFLREAVIASKFGVTTTTDAFYVAFSVPDLFLQLSLSGAAASAIIPLIAIRVRRSGKDAATQVTTAVLIFYALVSLAALAIGWPLMPRIIDVLAPGFTHSTDQLATNLGRIMLPAVLFTALAAALTGLANYDGRFFIPSLRFAVQSVFVIALVLVLADRVGITSAALGIVIGSLAALLLLMTQTRNLAYLRSAALGLDEHKAILLDYLRLAVPIMLTGILIQASLFGEKIAASYLESGSVAALVLSRKLAFFAIAISAGSFQTVIYPDLATAAAAGDEARMRYQTRRSLQITLVSSLAIAAAIWVAAEPATRLLLERGMFDASATAAVSGALRWFTLGVPVFATNSMLVKIFHARRRVTIPLLIGVVALIPYVALLIVLPKHLGLAGIILALVIADAFRLAMLSAALVAGLKSEQRGG